MWRKKLHEYDPSKSDEKINDEENSDEGSIN
jgi:hypothetical protein